MGGVYFSLYLLILLASGGNANPVCDFTVNPNEPKWVSAATILAETIVGYIPVVGKWAEAFIEIMAHSEEFRSNRWGSRLMAMFHTCNAHQHDREDE